MASKTSPRTRQTAPERREALVQAAVAHFAQTGLHGTAVSAITDDVGITQPYAFSLFGTKKGLFLAAVERGCERIAETFRAAAAGAGDEGPLAAMGAAYGDLMADRSLLLMQLATGMLINVAAAMDLPELFSDETWMNDCLGQAAAEAD
jgi:AcrR family transcriptional regulator